MNPKKITKGALNALTGSEEELSKQRMEICNKCPHKVGNPARCGVCQCFLNWKTRVPSETCPKNKW